MDESERERPQEVDTARKDSAWAIEIKNLSKTFQHITAVNNISFNIKQGELFGLLGPNGAGKSTLTKMLSAQLHPTTGTAILEGFDVQKNPMDVKRLIGVVPQEVVLYDYLNARENLLFFGDMYDVPQARLRERVAELLEFTALGDRASDPVKQYSGGMKRRLNIAAALVHDPQILLLDEPTTGVDPQSRRRVWEMIQNLQKERKTIILTTHLMDEADLLCDRVAIIDEGRVLVLNTPKQLKALLGEEGEEIIEIVIGKFIPEFFTRLNEAEGCSQVVTQEDEEGNVLVKMITTEAEIVLPLVVSMANKFDVKLRTVNLRLPTLEDVFIKLTGKHLRE